MTDLAVVTVVAGRHQHLRQQHESLDRGIRRPDLVVVVSMGDDTIPGLVAQGPLRDVALVLDVPPEGHGALPLARARNAGAAAAVAAGTDVLVFLDVDVRPPPDAAERFSAALGAPGALATVARLAPVGLDARDPYGLYLLRHRRGVPDVAAGQPVPWKHFVTAACAVRRDAFRTAGGFDEGVEYGEDLALAVALARAAPRGLVATGVTVEARDNGTLTTALAKVAQFGRALPTLAERAPDVYRVAGLGVLVRPTLASRLAAWTPLARVVRGLLPTLPLAVRVRAVRYLLGHTLLDAHARASSHARSRR